jgi:hypothetical protein
LSALAGLSDLLGAVLAAPHAVEPRLAYAAACGSERAQFIRLQLEAQRVARAGRPEWSGTASEAQRLLEQHDHRHRWAGEISSRVRWFAFYGGFVEHIQIDAATFLATAEELCRLAPVRRLILTGARPAIVELARSPSLACIVELSLRRQIGDAELAVLVASPHLANLAWLDLAFCELTTGSVETLARANLPALRYVNFAGTEVESFAETVGIDGVSGQPVHPAGSAAAGALEQRYGRKAWLHPFEDLGHELLEIEL